MVGRKPTQRSPCSPPNWAHETCPPCPPRTQRVRYGVFTAAGWPAGTTRTGSTRPWPLMAPGRRPPANVRLLHRETCRSVATPSGSRERGISFSAVRVRTRWLHRPSSAGVGEVASCVETVASWGARRVLRPMASTQLPTAPCSSPSVPSARAAGPRCEAAAPSGHLAPRASAGPHGGRATCR